MAENERVEGEKHAVFPQNWQIASDYDPNNHLMNLKGRDYLNVQNRLLWFIRDQRSFIALGLARMSYVIRTELVEMDREVGFAHFKTYVRDVLGNESTMYGSEAAKDFPDFAEKASTKSLGRALLSLGYGTAFAPEMDEGERVVDAPAERRRVAVPPRPQPTAARLPQPAVAETPRVMPATAASASGGEQPATEQQLISIRKLCAALDKPEPEGGLTYPQARTLITRLSGEYQRTRRAS
ncbi:MAG: hypothetical protein IVW57_01375 [Ktedonobacterales bacterium]|nr:hypothetical protein [Ktedonobacterales bacterium]